MNNELLVIENLSYKDVELITKALKHYAKYCQQEKHYSTFTYATKMEIEKQATLAIIDKMNN